MAFSACVTHERGGASGVDQKVHGEAQPSFKVAPQRLAGQEQVLVGQAAGLHVEVDIAAAGVVVQARAEQPDARAGAEPGWKP